MCWHCHITLHHPSPAKHCVSLSIRLIYISSRCLISLFLEQQPEQKDFKIKVEYFENTPGSLRCHLPLQGVGCPTRNGSFSHTPDGRSMCRHTARTHSATTKSRMKENEKKNIYNFFFFTSHSHFHTQVCDQKSFSQDSSVEKESKGLYTSDAQNPCKCFVH